MGGRSGQRIARAASRVEARSPSVDFVADFSFTNEKGNEVTQYKLSSNDGGYARVEKSPDGFVVTNVIIGEGARGKGVATRLYIELNKESVRATGQTLQSIKKDRDGNIELSADGQALWESFVKKGLAKRIGKKRYRFIS
jgi:hypothetical protein